MPKKETLKETPEWSEKDDEVFERYIRQGCDDEDDTDITTIQEWKEKAEKWDRYYDPDRWTGLEEEEKQLKEELRKYQVLQWTPKELEIELNKGIINRLKLEKIEELIKTTQKGNCGGQIASTTLRQSGRMQVIDQLKDILKVKET